MGQKTSEEEGCALFGEATLDSCVKKRETRMDFVQADG